MSRRRFIWHRTVASIHLSAFLLGIFKGGFFGVLVALTGLSARDAMRHQRRRRRPGHHLGGGDRHHLDHRLGWHFRRDLQRPAHLSREHRSRHQDRDSRPDDGVRLVRGDARHQRAGQARRGVHHHGRQRLRQEHAAAAHDRAEAAGQGRHLLRWRALLAIG